jgi:hypothetical protein
MNEKQEYPGWSNEEAAVCRAFLEGRQAERSMLASYGGWLRYDGLKIAYCPSKGAAASIRLPNGARGKVIDAINLLLAVSGLPHLRLVAKETADNPYFSSISYSLQNSRTGQTCQDINELLCDYVDFATLREITNDIAYEISQSQNTTPNEPASHNA